MERPAAMSPDLTSTELPDLLYSQPESDLRQAVRSLFSVRCSPADLLARTESNQTYDTSLWHALAAELGCSGLLIPESAGGAGASYREAAVVAEEAGRAVAPVPYLGSGVVATAALLAAVGAEPAAEEDRKLLAALADGTLTAALVVPFESMTGRPAQRPIRVVGSSTGDQPGSYRLTGTASRLVDTLPADVLLVPGDGVPFALYVVDAKADGVTRTPSVSLDQTRQLCELKLDNVPARRIAGGDAAAAAVRAALLAGAAMLASEQLGVAEQCLEMTVAYAKERRQFARQIGSFQAIKHRLADLWVAVTQARAAARYAAACLADESQPTGYLSGQVSADAALAVSLAKAYCGDVAVKAAEECVQLHGGIGFTWEHPAHLYLKRAKSASIGYGTPDRHRAALADLADLPAPDAGASA
ncbi:MAG TPA: acyl-CoA dehydrogenase family protein [Streptosporangiaceae bacterium]|jgi:alkylation response protein AidB-like acyl-CoA dehydrogenase